MHEEQMVVSLAFLKQWLLFGSKAVAVGTTSMRTLESLYWYGVKLLNGETNFLITQHDPYRSYSFTLPDLIEAIAAIINYMELNNLQEITGYTGIYLYPGYSFKAVGKIITNFHQPGSTLILLVAAFIGEDWRKVYQEALDNNYRFLSYGDSSLLIP
jgi:S-adenosylmethionine:tRNA ribosyltransferase-isomerase